MQKGLQRAQTQIESADQVVDTERLLARRKDKTLRLNQPSNDSNYLTIAHAQS